MHQIDGRRRTRRSRDVAGTVGAVATAGALVVGLQLSAVEASPAEDTSTDNALAPDAAAQPTAPYNVAFYYPWFPETWNRSDHFAPAQGLYRSDDQDVIERHVDDMTWAGLDAAISSWWGPGSATAERLALLLDEAERQGKGFKIAAYHEDEGYTNPGPAAIAADLRALSSQADRDGYLRVDGKPVVFVYNADDRDCGVVDRWAPSFDEWHVVMKVFSGYLDCANQPAGWHQYGAGTDQQGTLSYSVSPGFFAYQEDTPRHARDPEQFRLDLEAQKASGATWQTIVSYNEWGEGTAVEEATAWENDGRGTYLDIIHEVLLAPK